MNANTSSSTSSDLQPLVVDLSHWEWPCDLKKVKAAGYVGVLWKATQGISYIDDTYKKARALAKTVGLRWGSYHFGDDEDVDGQVANYLNWAQPAGDEIFCLDWEPLDSGSMSANQAQGWIIGVEEGLNRKGECLIYSGNLAKESLTGKNMFFGARRLWLAQYGTTPTWQESWDGYWLWQFTDGEVGPTPHTVNGVGECDINSYGGTRERLQVEWASGHAVAPVPVPPVGPIEPEIETVTLTISAPAHIRVNVVTEIVQTQVG